MVVLDLLPNPNTYTDPEVFRTAFIGIARLVDTYLNAADNMKKDTNVVRLNGSVPLNLALTFVT